MKSFFYWTVMALLALPAIVGTMLCLAIAAVCIMAFFLSLALLLLGCVPVIWWCALWESSQTYQLLAKVRSFKKQPHE